MGLHYQEAGNTNAALMVFLHGGGVSSWMWRKQIQYFTNFHCLAVDLPEQGRSRDVLNFSIRTSADNIIELIERKADGKQVIVIGFSLGAQVLIEMLSLKPDLIDCAIINSALVRPIPLVKKLIRPSIKLTFPLIKNKSFSRLQARTLYVDKEYFKVYYDETCQMKRDTLIRILEENMSFELPPDFKKAKGKILVTVGEKEKAVMKRSARIIVENNSNCTGIIIPSIGHGVSLVKPEFFNGMVEKWIYEREIPMDCKILK